MVVNLDRTPRFLARFLKSKPNDDPITAKIRTGVNGLILTVKLAVVVVMTLLYGLWFLLVWGLGFILGPSWVMLMSVIGAWFYLVTLFSVARTNLLREWQEWRK